MIYLSLSLAMQMSIAMRVASTFPVLVNDIIITDEIKEMGITDLDTRDIHIREGMTVDDLVYTMRHEMCHLLLEDQPEINRMFGKPPFITWYAGSKKGHLLIEEDFAEECANMMYGITTRKQRYIDKLQKSY